MKRFGKFIYWFLVPTVLFVAFDEWVKNTALRRLPGVEILTETKMFVFAIHKNYGLAFDIPFRREFIILITLFLGYYLLKIAYQNFTRHPDLSFASLLIIVGALGNLFDRIVYGFTVDYILLFGRSAFNLSDIIIILGVILFLLASRRPKGHNHVHPDEPV